VETVETSDVAGEGRGVGSGLERVVTPYSRIFSGRPWPIFEVWSTALDPEGREMRPVELGSRSVVYDDVLGRGERAVLEERRSFAMFDGEAWTFGPVTDEEEAAWRELERRLARL
jgi:hypothetical protein